jgi:hypothetical protein
VHVFVDWRTRHALHSAWARGRVAGGRPKLLFPLLGPGQAAAYARRKNRGGGGGGGGHTREELARVELVAPQMGMPCVLRLHLRPDPSIRVQWFRTNRHGIAVPVPEQLAPALALALAPGAVSAAAAPAAAAAPFGGGLLAEREMGGGGENREYSAVETGAILHIRSFKRRDEGESRV